MEILNCYYFEIKCHAISLVILDDMFQSSAFDAQMQKKEYQLQIMEIVHMDTSGIRLHALDTCEMDVVSG